MGIRDIHLLTDPNSINRKVNVSQHIVEDERFKYVFGWDQNLQSFYLQVHDSTIIDPENNPVHWYGADSKTTMYEVEDLCRMAQSNGLHIDYATRVKLYGEKDDGV